MAFATVTPIAHGLGAVLIGGAIKLQTGKIILFIKNSTLVYEMADAATPAVLFHTAAFPLKFMTAGIHKLTGFDRVVIAGDENVVYVEYDGVGVGTPSDVALPAVFAGQTFEAMTWGDAQADQRFYILGTGRAAAHLFPLNPTGLTVTDWTQATGLITLQNELPGFPVFMNAYGLQLGQLAYDATHLCSWIFSTPSYVPDKTFLITQGKPVTCYFFGKPGRKIAGARDGYLFTDLGGEQLVPRISDSNENEIIAVFFSDLHAKYLMCENPNDPGDPIEVQYSTDGITWLLASFTNLPFDNPDPLAVDGRGVAFFATLVTNAVFAFRGGVVDQATTEAAPPKLRWWKSPDAITWTFQGSENDRVIGFYSNSGAGPTEIIKLNTLTGEMFWSTDEAATAFNGPTAVLIPPADAALIRWIQETPKGLIAWGVNGPIYESVAANLHTVPWVNLDWPGGEIGAHMRVDDASRPNNIHRRFDGGSVVSEHWESWDRTSTPSWVRQLVRQWNALQNLDVQFFGIASGKTINSPTWFLSARIGAQPVSPVALAQGTAPTTSLKNAKWMSDIDPDVIGFSTGPRQIIVLAVGGRIKYANHFNVILTTIGLQGSLLDAEDKFRDEFGTVKNASVIFVDGDVMVVMDFNGVVATSDNGSTWFPVLSDPDLDGGHRTIVP